MVMPNVLAIYTMVDVGAHDIGLVLGYSKVDAVPYHVVWRVLSRVMYITWIVAAFSLKQGCTNTFRVNSLSGPIGELSIGNGANTQVSYAGR